MKPVGSIRRDDRAQRRRSRAPPSVGQMPSYSFEEVFRLLQVRL